ncbi:Heterokaryon incompatibility protein 6, OR allele [Colletotrichum trifolii]|uniref:Heterokaryon incompatibility protein 6, OR allele n=1 Tax=Colletotrichum trifolii TaxID=5466 RepID=A0A4R8RCH8_COLTR|nr:Heterokaryon incompatibility protein 6, OR allele [Colletotrichum trifolii]
MASPYPYRPLELPYETRVLTIKPGNFDDELVCGLTHMNFASPDEPYEALSYCWSKGVDRDPGIDPDTEIPWAVYGRDDDGNVVEKSGTTPWKDLVDDEYQGESYIRLGGRMPDAPILCDGVSLTVGGELFRALRRLRHGTAPLRIWVDALCINQQDVAERNEHVKIMGDVYAGAARTRVWLGESTRMDFQALRTLWSIGDVLDDLFVKRGMLKSGATMQEIQWHFNNTADTDQLDWGLLSEVLDRAWFKRTWIIQEVVNSKAIAVHLGELEFPWTSMSAVVKAVMEYKLQATITECKAFKAISVMEDLRLQRTGDSEARTTMPLLSLLEELRDFRATIPSDKIYGILGLTDRKDDFVVDYTQSPEDVFTNLAVEELHAGKLDILAHCVDSSKPTTLKLPSWVPDWTRPGWTEPLRIRGLNMSAAGETRPDLSVNKGEGTLRIRGRVLDRLAVIETRRLIPPPNQAGPMEPDDSDQTSSGGKIGMAKYGDTSSDTEERRASDENPINDARYRHSKMVKKAAQHHKYWHLGVIDVAFPDKTATRQTLENLWRTFMCNRTRDNEVPGESGSTGFDIFFKIVTGDKGPAEILQERVDHMESSHGLSPQDADAYYTAEKEAFEMFSGAHSKWCYNRRFFRSESGRFGWGVEGIRSGDAVVLFHGCGSVFILRDAGEGRWRIVGDCYIHGLMDGQGVDEQFEEVYLQIV